MKHFLRTDTASVILFFLTVHLLFSPLFSEISLAQNTDFDAPIISHFPIQVARFGDELTIRAHVFDDSEIDKVTLILSNGTKTIRGVMPEIVRNGRVPVEVFSIEELTLYSGPASRFGARGTIMPGELMGVSRIKNNYGRIISASGLRGYVDMDGVDVVTLGYSYGVTIPGKMTQLNDLYYQIEAVDIHGNVKTSKETHIRFITEEQVAMALEALKAGRQPDPAIWQDRPVASQPTVAQNPSPNRTIQDPAEPATESAASQSSSNYRPAGQGAPVYGKPWFWGAVGLVGGGAYYLLSNNVDESEKPATIDVIVEWE